MITVVGILAAVAVGWTLLLLTRPKRAQRREDVEAARANLRAGGWTK